MKRMKEAVGDTTALYGLVCGPFTLASHLRGNALFTDMFDFEEEACDLISFCAGPCKEIFDHIRAQGAFSSFFVCGDATRNIEVMCQTGPDGISVDENVDLLKAKEITDRT